MTEGIIEILKNVKHNQETIMKRLDLIENRLMIVENSGNKMNNHIDFVENIYESIKAPFHYVMDTVSKFRTIESDIYESYPTDKNIKAIR